RARLNADFARYQVLAIRDQRFSPEEFMQAGRVFGALMPHHRKSGGATAETFLFRIRNEEVAPGKYYIAGETFHTDHSNDPVPPKATSLYTVSLPSRGGDTQFVNMHAAYDALPVATKRRVHAPVPVPVYPRRYRPRQPAWVEDEKPVPPPALHPLVRIHPDNGRKFLYLNPVRMEAIVGMPDDEAQALIGDLMAHATQ